MLQTQTKIALATTLSLSALAMLWGCSTAREPAHEAAPSPAALPASQAGGLAGDAGREYFEHHRVTEGVDSVAPGTRTYKYTPTTYFPTYYPTTPTTTSDGTVRGPAATGGTTMPGPTGPSNPTSPTGGPTGPTTTPRGPTGPTGPTNPTGPTRNPFMGGNSWIDRGGRDPYLQGGERLPDAIDLHHPRWAPQPGEELWVIERPKVPAANWGKMPGQGELFGLTSDGEKIPAPLKHTDVQARIQGHVGSVQVTQQYQNPFTQKIEAVYTFPLPSRAAVSEFVMVVGNRRIRGLVREREEAEQIYRDAKQAGYVASLMTQERPNIFTQKVANIEPGRQIDIAITYFETLEYRDGWYEWVFPMVAGPRFNPPGARNPVHTNTLKNHKLRTGHDIALRADIDAGVRIEEIECHTHEITRDLDGGVAQVRLHKLDSIPNRDFVLRWRVAGRALKTTLTTQPDGSSGGGWFTLTLYPPQRVDATARRPMELVFVLDCSGSMAGVPLHKAKSAIKRALRSLQPGDTFQVIRFSTDASQLGATPLPATPDNVARGLAYVNALQGTGGTMMIEGIKAALDFPHDPKRARVVSFMTDGYIGNEAQILREVDHRLRGTRIFSFGVGGSPNRYLLEGLARMGRGAVAWVGLDDETGGAAVDAFYDRLSHPALADVQIDFGKWHVSGLYPRRLPELYVGRPITVVGRYQGEPGEPIILSGTVHGEAQRFLIEPAVARHPGISKVWARIKIADLFAQHAVDVARRAALQQQITGTALEYGILSQWTAFLAVDASRKTEGGAPTTVNQPTQLPAGMKPTGPGGTND